VRPMKEGPCDLEGLLRVRGTVVKLRRMGRRLVFCELVLAEVPRPEPSGSGAEALDETASFSEGQRVDVMLEPTRTTFRGGVLDVDRFVRAQHAPSTSNDGGQFRAQWHACVLECVAQPEALPNNRGVRVLQVQDVVGLEVLPLHDPDVGEAHPPSEDKVRAPLAVGLRAPLAAGPLGYALRSLCLPLAFVMLNAHHWQVHLF